MDAVRAEDGCISYDYYFSAESPDTVLLIEKWLRPSSRKRICNRAHGELMKIKEKYILNTAVEKPFYKELEKRKKFKI